MGARRVTLRHAAYALAGFVALIAVGTVGFVLILDESGLDALYRTVITVYTAGLVAAPQSVGAKIFTIVLVVWGVAIFLWVFALVIELAVGGTVSGAWQERRTRRRVNVLEEHFIICGYGRVGRRIAAEFGSAGVDYVVVEHDAEVVAAARERGELVIEGSATDDEVLERAGLERARGLIACIDSDAENVYIVLSARGARPDLLIAARASSEDAAKKLYRAGADRVVSPYTTAAKELVTMVLKPHVAAFLDVVTGAGGPEFRFEQIEVTAACGQQGRTIRDLAIRQRTGAMIIAHRRRDQGFNTRPDPDTRLAEGDVLIGVGTPEEIQALEDLFKPREAVA